MNSFTLTLSTGSILSGLSCIPSHIPAQLSQPLIVGIHGGTYSSRYFHPTPSTSAASISTVLGIPFIAIDRAGYNKSTKLPVCPAGSTFLQEEGKHLHKYILPAIWQEFGKSSGSTSIVLLTHSLGSGSAIIAASLLAQEEETLYPLSGLIISGWGTTTSIPRTEAERLLSSHTTSDRLHFPLAMKDLLMFGHRESKCVDPRMYDLTESLDNGMSYGEFQDVNMTWLMYWKKYAATVQVPVMYCLGERDSIWEATNSNIRNFSEAFKASPRVERVLILGAPHCIELSLWSKSWYLRAFGFACGCAVSDAQQ
ncbi:hypothetical protein OIDMADRAFT_136869 [Oidiodendron maius Zn]|uniref:AB hydrolase-1 domain-containing protein n=1 Tax=Oidiodendron maius (strain Zn) TaxID=913774 RepID=A0A0C3GCI6_OIDMZ|nr:hypothetical protein OIDMADRAFT_136869 [Oidiodendron maius Zn]